MSLLKSDPIPESNSLGTFYLFILDVLGPESILVYEPLNLKSKGLFL